MTTGEWPSFIHHGIDEGDGVVYGLRTPGEGIKVGGHHEGPVVDPDERSFDPDPERVAQSRALRRALVARRRARSGVRRDMPVHDDPY